MHGQRKQYSQNIKALCPNCCSGFQKFKKFIQVEENGVSRTIAAPPNFCPYCLKRQAIIQIKEIPEALIPWKVIDLVALGPYDRYYINPFICTKCNVRYRDFYTFGALCQHSTHVPPTGYVCRWCCTEEQPAPLQPPKQKKETAAERRARKRAYRREVINERFLEPDNQFMEVVVAPEQFFAQPAHPWDLAEDVVMDYAAIEQERVAEEADLLRRQWEFDGNNENR